MTLPHQGDRLGGEDYPFGDQIESLHDAVRANVEAALSPEYRVVEITATLRTTYDRPLASKGEIHPAFIPPFLPVMHTLEFAVHAEKVTTVYRPDWIDLTVSLIGRELVVMRVSLGRAF